MNSIQLGILSIVIILILIVIAYYWYQDMNFKRIVEDNFNTQSFDISNSNQPLILDKLDSTESSVFNKDIAISGNITTDLTKNASNEMYTINSPLESENSTFIPSDSLEAIFAELDSTPFNIRELDQSLDYIVDIVFEEPRKLKFLPEINKLTNHPFNIYILDKNDQWQEYSKSNKYNANAVKFVVEMISHDGSISNIQINNIYNELRQFILQNDAHIRQSDYIASLNNIKNQIQYASKVRLDLELFLILKEKINYTSLNDFFLNNELIKQNGSFNFVENGKVLFSIKDENNQSLQNDLSYELLLITAPLHLSTSPNQVTNKIFDIVEKFMQQFESRLLTINKQVFTNSDYVSLTRHITNYVNEAKKHNIELGGKLLYRMQEKNILN